MRIAIPAWEGLIEKRAEDAPSVIFYDIEEDEILSREEISVSGEKDILKKLTSADTDTFICLSMGAEMMVDLSLRGIEIIGGVRGPADRALKKYISGKLENDDLILDCPGGECNGDCSKCH